MCKKSTLLGVCSYNENALYRHTVCNCERASETIFWLAIWHHKSLHCGAFPKKVALMHP